VQLFNAGIKKTADVAGRLTDALLVLDQRDAHEPLAVLAKCNARRHRHLGLLDQQLGEFQAAQFGNASGNGAQANIEAAGGGTGNPARPKLSTSASRRFL